MGCRHASLFFKKLWELLIFNISKIFLKQPRSVPIKVGGSERSYLAAFEALRVFTVKVLKLFNDTGILKQLYL